MNDTVLVDVADGLCTLTLNRPDKRNALNGELFDALTAAMDAIEADETVGCVVLRGAGKAFCAGADLGGVGTGSGGNPHAHQKVIERLANLPVPTVAAIHGICYTGGLELALAGDLIVASANARFGDTHGKWALTPVWGMSQRLPRRVGAAKAKEMMFTSRTYSGAQAEAMGLANFCFPDEAFDSEVEKLIGEILANSWFSHRANKRLIVDTEGLPLEAGLAHEIYKSEGRGPDSQERIAAFMKK